MGVPSVSETQSASNENKQREPQQPRLGYTSILFLIFHCLGTGRYSSRMIFDLFVFVARPCMYSYLLPNLSNCKINSSFSAEELLAGLSFYHSAETSMNRSLREVGHGGRHPPADSARKLSFSFYHVIALGGFHRLHRAAVNVNDCRVTGHFDNASRPHDHEDLCHDE